MAPTQNDIKQQTDNLTYDNISTNKTQHGVNESFLFVKNSFVILRQAGLPLLHLYLECVFDFHFEAYFIATK